MPYGNKFLLEKGLSQ